MRPRLVDENGRLCYIQPELEGLESLCDSCRERDGCPITLELDDVIAGEDVGVKVSACRLYRIAPRREQV